jgi:phage shock protein PspC (stress-responsive transcriptional regulator)
VTYPYQQQPTPPRKLLRSRNNRVLSGVCGGVAEYFNMDPTLVRVLTVVVALFTSGVPVIILYLIALFAVPEQDPDQPPSSYPPVGQGGSFPAYPQYPYQAGQPGSDQPAYAPRPSPQAAPQPYGSSSASADNAVWGQEGAPWEQRQPQQPPSWGSNPADPGGSSPESGEKRP